MVLSSEFLTLLWTQLIGVRWLLLPSLLIYFYWLWCRSRFVRLVNALPGPPALPLLGNFLDLNVDHDEYLKLVHFDWVRKYGQIYRVWAGERPVVIISSPELMEPILVSHKLITKATEYNYLSPWLGNCLFLTTGTRWKNRRRLLTPAFHFQILNSFIDIFNEKSIECSQRLEDEIDFHSGGEIDVFPIMTQCALNIICETSIGRRTRSQEEKGAYVTNLHRIGKIVMERAIRPWLTTSWMFNLSSLGKENQQCVKALHQFTNQVIEDRRIALKTLKNENPVGEPTNNNVGEDRETKDHLAFLDLLIHASENGAGLTDDEIREEVDLVMFAGHDTTASAMTWFLYCLAKHPHQQQMVIDELDQVFGYSDRPCTTRDLVDCKYLECCIKETLRLYPSVPAVMRCLTEDVDLGGYTLPAGVSVALMMYGMHHSASVFPDPQSFKPERFLPENSIGRHPYAFIPFSAGPRNCIGQRYGMMEIKFVLANLLRRFRFSLTDTSGPMLVPSSEVVLKPKNGVFLNVSRRPR